MSNPLTGHDQERVTATMAEAVVDEFEPVQVDKEHGDLLAMVVCLLHYLRQAIKEQRSIWQ